MEQKRHCIYLCCLVATGGTGTCIATSTSTSTAAARSTIATYTSTTAVVPCRQLFPHGGVVVQQLHEQPRGAEVDGIVEPVHVMPALHHAPDFQLELFLQAGCPPDLIETHVPTDTKDKKRGYYYYHHLHVWMGLL